MKKYFSSEPNNTNNLKIYKTEHTIYCLETSKNWKLYEAKSILIFWKANNLYEKYKKYILKDIQKVLSAQKNNGLGKSSERN